MVGSPPPLKGTRMRVERLYRYPIKGLSPEALEAVAVEAGQCFPWDRAFALAQGDAPFDPAAPRFVPKQNFMCLMANARCAELQSAFDSATGMLVIRSPTGSVAANALTEEGRREIGAWLTRFLGEEARGRPTFHHVPGHTFADQRGPVVSLINLGSLAAFEHDQGAARDPMRFRANVYFSGLAPWAEFAWVEREVQLGAARLRVVKRTRRCPATQVNPATARRDADPPKELMALYGHQDLGVHAVVTEGGRIAVGDALEVLV
jgi:hypothetical protein